MNNRTAVRQWPARLVLAVVTLAGCNGSPTVPHPTIGQPTPGAVYTLTGGRVSEPAGNVVDGVLVQIGDRSATTDSAGRLALSELVAGPPRNAVEQGRV